MHRVGVRLTEKEREAEEGGGIHIERAERKIPSGKGCSVIYGYSDTLWDWGKIDCQLSQYQNIFRISDNGITFLLSKTVIIAE